MIGKRHCLGVLAFAWLAFSNAPAMAGDSCIVGFDDPSAFTRMYNQARGHFGAWSMLSGSTVVPCSDPDGAPGCWFYKEQCGATSNYVHVLPFGNNTDHLHFPFDDPAMTPLCTCDPGDGHGVGYSYEISMMCTPVYPPCIDWTQKTRSEAYPHTWEDQVIVEVLGGASTFDLFDITVGGSQDVVVFWDDGISLQGLALNPGYWVLPEIVKARYVVVGTVEYFYGGGNGSPLGIVDLGVYAPGGLYSLAEGQDADQSSTYSGTPELAADGNTDGNFWNGSVTHTNSNAGAWWKVNLGLPRRIGDVKIWNRTDCCASRLSNFDVELSSDDSTWTNGQYVSGTAGTPTTLNFSGALKQYVRVKLRGTDYLSLAEVQVFPY